MHYRNVNMKNTGNSAYCIVCKSPEIKPHYYPHNIFNNKKFDYFHCLNCDSISIYPIPSKEDFDIIYGENDYKELFSLVSDEKLAYNYKYPKYSYQRYQLKYFDEAIKYVKGKRMLDYGCGSGYYMNYAKHKGFECYGIEFNREFAELISVKSGFKVVSIEDADSEFGNIKFDVIHFGHILEHLPDPAAALKWTYKYTHKETVFIIDGPLEANKCLSRILINLSAYLHRYSVRTYVPQHLSFTTYHSQLKFFESLNLRTIKYECREQYWPLPDHWDFSSLKNILLHFISLVSIQVSRIFRRSGNIFHYVGMLKN